MGWRSGCCKVLAIVAILLPCVLGKEYVVGDEHGWSINFDYQAWAQGKLFFVGDSLIFNYQQERHNVFKVNGTAFKECTPPANVPPLTTGSDRIQLKSAGKKWYICGIGFHCTAGQRLAITVLDKGAGVPSPSPSPRLLPTPPASLPTNSTNAPPPAPSTATKAAVSVFLMVFTILLAGIL
ncbi:stellacyanin [Cucumis sativus]|uniref:stellacyanin n=1 Tax=Cucumis sativus TaxID=3659 RepID=UPI0002B436F9|nr:stellacyanin [Cucumis sativus]KGN49700.2 hypothetical protein Csa_000594 [Cucumis sativus]